jgi:hypothetical protein
LQFIQRFDLHFSVEICKLDNDVLPKVRLYGRLPSLTAFVSVDKIVKFLYLFDTAFPPDALPEILEDTQKIDIGSPTPSQNKSARSWLFSGSQADPTQPLAFDLSNLTSSEKFIRENLEPTLLTVF